MQPHRLWDCVERMPGLAGVQLDWQLSLGEDFTKAAKYLRPTNHKATSLPCRVGCAPSCRRRVVRHAPGDVVAVCNEGDPKYRIDESDLISHELNLGAVCRDLCGALGVEPAIERVAGLHQTWQCGFLKSRQGTRHPVYLSIQMEDQHLVEVALRLSAMNRKPMTLLLPTTRRINDLVRHVLDSAQTVWTPLDRTVGWSTEGRMIADMNLAEILEQEITSEAEQLPADDDNRITIERKELDDGVHWIVAGVDKGVFYRRSDSKQAFILDTLYERIGHGWVPHSFFIKYLGWTEAAYFGSSIETKRMQKQLNLLRNFLGVEIEFRKDRGVRFAKSVLRSI